MTINRPIAQPELGPKARALIASLEQLDDYYGAVIDVIAEALENAQAASETGDLADLVTELTSSDILPTLRLPLSFTSGPSGAHIWQNDGDGLDADGANLICRAINALAGLPPTQMTLAGLSPTPATPPDDPSPDMIDGLQAVYGYENRP